jgi:hypothetical protein
MTGPSTRAWRNFTPDRTGLVKKAPTTRKSWGKQNPALKVPGGAAAASLCQGSEDDEP